MEHKVSEGRYENMNYRRAGDSGLKLPEIALGFWLNFGSNGNQNTMKEICFTAFDAGITYFDLANNYGPVPGSAEENVGRILKEHFHMYRNELIVSTKAGYRMWAGPYGDGGSRKHMLESLEQSLRRLQLEYVDIFYHHRMDPETPLEETMNALAMAVKSGKALYAGLSNYNGEQMMQASAILKEMNCPFVVNQNRYSMFDRTVEQNGLLKVARDEQKGVVAFSPLAQGLLSDRYLNGIPKDSRIRKDGRFLKEEKLTGEVLKRIKSLHILASERGETLAQMALAWVLRKPTVTSVLIGASSKAQVHENVKCINRPSFTEEEINLIDAVCLSEEERNGSE